MNLRAEKHITAIWTSRVTPRCSRQIRFFFIVGNVSSSSIRHLELGVNHPIGPCRFLDSLNQQLPLLLIGPAQVRLAPDLGKLAHAPKHVA